MTIFSRSSLNGAYGSLIVTLAVLLCAGCGKKEEPEDITDLCREDCESYADSCPEGSAARETEQFCKVFCVVFEDTKDCREKWKERRECLADYSMDCETGSIDDGGACDLPGDPFVINLSDEDASGECVGDNLTTE